MIIKIVIIKIGNAFLFEEDLLLINDLPNAKKFAFSLHQLEMGSGDSETTDHETSFTTYYENTTYSTTSTYLTTKGKLKYIL